MNIVLHDKELQDALKEEIHKLVTRDLKQQVVNASADFFDTKMADTIKNAIIRKADNVISYSWNGKPHTDMIVQIITDNAQAIFKNSKIQERIDNYIEHNLESSVQSWLPNALAKLLEQPKYATLLSKCMEQAVAELLAKNLCSIKQPQ